MKLSLLLAIQLFCTFALTGLIWTVQCVHYPAFRYAHVENFKLLHNFHSQKITWIVAPLMVGELFSAALLLIQYNSIFWIFQLVLMLLLWSSTAFLSVPIHNKLTNGYNLKHVNRLISTNWPRTILWSAKSLLLLYFITREQG